MKKNLYPKAISETIDGIARTFESMQEIEYVVEVLDSKTGCVSYKGFTSYYFYSEYMRKNNKLNGRYKIIRAENRYGGSVSYEEY